jgi:hypothetical protein
MSSHWRIGMSHWRRLLDCALTLAPPLLATWTQGVSKGADKSEKAQGFQNAGEGAVPNPADLKRSETYLQEDPNLGQCSQGA